MRTGYIRSLLVGFIVLLGLISCKTPNSAQPGSAVFDGSAPGAATTAVGESSDELCNKFGGEIVDGECICADGTAKKDIKNANHCSAWVKKTFPDCYNKGGMPKSFGGGEQLCVCPHGEELDKNADSCYDMFKKRFPDCGKKGGIVLADDSTCRCLHGRSALKLSGNCEADFQKNEERCSAKRGVLEKGSACRCRDGSIVDNDEKSKCAEPWFFYKDQTIITASADGAAGSADTAKIENIKDDKKDDGKKVEDKKDDGKKVEDKKDDTKNENKPSTQDASNKKAATCSCQHYLDHCIIYKPGDKNAIKWLKTTADKCTRNLCYKNFSDIIFEPKSDKDGAGGCDGSWDYKATLEATAEKKEEAKVDIEKYCVCKKLRGTSPVGCGLFLPGKTQPNTYANTHTACTPEDCVNLFGDSYTIKTHCYDSTTKKFLWRHQD
jgi:hypothetical protein